MSIREKLEGEQIIIRLIALTLLGAGIQVLLIAGITWEVGIVSSVPPVVVQNGTIVLRNDYLLMNQTLAFAPPSVTPKPIQPLSFAFFASYFFLTVGYSIAASLSFRPKRLISPLHIQIATAVFMSVILSAPFIMFSHTQIVNLSAIQNLVFTFFLYSGLMIVAGFAQTVFVVHIIGMTGSVKDLDRKAFSIHAPFESVRKIIRQSDILNLKTLRTIKRTKSLLVLKNHDRTNEQLIIALAPDEDKNKSILAAVSYESSYTAITRTPDASTMGESVLKIIEDRLDKLGIKVVPLPDGTINIATTDATIRALSNTHSAFEEIQGFPPFIKKMMIANVCALGIVIAAWYYKAIEQTQFIEFLALLGIAVLFEFLPLIREARKESETESISAEDGQE